MFVIVNDNATQTLPLLDTHVMMQHKYLFSDILLALVRLAEDIYAWDLENRTLSHENQQAGVQMTVKLNLSALSLSDKFK